MLACLPPQLVSTRHRALGNSVCKDMESSQRTGYVPDRGSVERSTASLVCCDGVRSFVCFFLHTTVYICISLHAILQVAGTPLQSLLGFLRSVLSLTMVCIGRTLAGQSEMCSVS